MPKKTSESAVVTRVQAELSLDENERFERILSRRRRKGEAFAKGACARMALLEWMDRQEVSENE